MKKAVLLTLITVLAFGILGCGKKGSSVDPDKPMSEVNAEAGKMDIEQLKATALKYKDAIFAKRKEIEALAAKVKPTDLLSNEAKEIKAEIDDLNKALNALKERFEVYYNKLKEKGGDVSGLEI